MKALRLAGASVLSLSPMGKGCPDLLVGRNGKNLLFEIKDPKQPASQRVLTEDEADFFDTWRGHKVVVQNVEQAVILLELHT